MINAFENLRGGKPYHIFDEDYKRELFVRWVGV